MLNRSNSRTWTDDDTERLRLHIAAGGSAYGAVAKFNRSTQALRTKAAQHGLKFPTIRQLRKRAAGPDQAQGDSV
jgi:hypothetical protein